jgi:hypothetical protein
LVIGYTEQLQLLTTNNYNALTNLHTLQITIGHASLHWSSLGNSSSLYTFGADRIENAASDSSSIVACVSAAVQWPQLQILAFELSYHNILFQICVDSFMNKTLQ